MRCLAVAPIYGVDEATAEIDMTKWPAPVIRLWLGEMTQEAVLAAFN
jgi:hypothetical protein